MPNTTQHKALANSTATAWKLRGCGDHRGRGLAQVAHESVESATHIMAMGLARYEANRKLSYAGTDAPCLVILASPQPELQRVPYPRSFSAAAIPHTVAPRRISLSASRRPGSH